MLGNLTANKVKSVDEWNNLEAGIEQSIPSDSDIPTDTITPAVNNADVPASTPKAVKESDIPE